MDAGYVFGLRYYAGRGVATAFQINTDEELDNDTTSVVQEMETRPAEAVLSAGGRGSDGEK